jgi:hypothetical protein
VQFTKFDAKAWFEHNGVGMREVKVVAWKPASSSGDSADAIYRGPLQQIRDDQGITYMRGQRVSIPLATWTMLRQSPQAAQFVFIEPAQADATCQIIPSPTLARAKA